jgi:ribonuclease HI
MEVVKIFTDGAAKGNPGPGGFGVVMKFRDQVKEFSQGYRLTTNNRMELLAVIHALEQLKSNKFPIQVYSDSKYVTEAINQKWVFGWQTKGFKGKKNPDLWRRYLAIHSSFNLTFHWIKGHNGHPENERCDELAVQAATSDGLLVDEFFEAEQENLLKD